MRCCCGCCLSVRNRFELWIRDYDRLQSLAVLLIYIQIGCALIGSVGAQYNGVLLVNLAICLFALVAIESSSQSLGRTYAVLLTSSILLDVFWFILFSHQIWNISSDDHDIFFVVSVKLAFVMQIIGFSVRLSSSLLWIQMYRLGASYLDNPAPREADYDLRTSFLSPATPAAVRAQDSDEAIGGSIYDPAYYSSLFEETPDNQAASPTLRQTNGTFHTGSPVSEISQLKLSLSRSLKAPDRHDNGLWDGRSGTSQLNPSRVGSFQADSDDNAANKDQIV